MATVKEIETFLEAAVPSELVDSVFEKLRAVGGDSENVADVGKALQAVIEDTDAAATGAEDGPATAGLTGQEAAAQDAGAAAEAGFPGVVAEIERIFAPVHQAIDDLSSRIAELENAKAEAAPDAVDPTQAAPETATEPPSSSEASSSSTASPSPTDPAEPEADGA